jgi:CRISPR-associated protein Cst1
MTIQTQLTGEPFVDVGALVMETIPGETVEEKIRFVTDVYVDKWGGNISGVFWHSKITHSSYRKKGTQKKESLKYYIEELQENINSACIGYCRICSSKAPIFKCRRDNYPLTGSGELVNFCHLHEEGLLACKECIRKVFFLPFGLLQSGKKMLLLLQIQDQFTAKFWQEEVIRKNLDKIGCGTSDGIFSGISSHPHNALFEIAKQLIEKFEHRDLPTPKLRLFRFTNMKSEVTTEIYDLPNNAFNFIKRVLKPDLKKDWLYFIKKNFMFEKTTYFDEDSREWIETKQKNVRKLDFNNYAGSSKNLIYKKILSGQSILINLYKMHKNGKFSIMITLSYLKEVRKMNQERIDAIRRLSDQIVALCQKEGSFKKRLAGIEYAKYSYKLREAIIKMAKVHYESKEEKPFVPSDEYIEYLFPDGQGWSETRDFLLICLYEKIHELKISPEELPGYEAQEPVADIIDDNE